MRRDEEGTYVEDQSLCSLRSEVYKILSVCFQYPGQDFFRYVKGNLLKDLNSSLTKLLFSENLESTYELFQPVLRARLAKCSLDDLQVEYTGLFIYAGDALCCLPYESIYREKGKRLSGESTVSVKQFYRRFKICVSPEFRDLADHLAVELNFMHFLAYNEDMFSTRGQEQESNLCTENERIFLNKHLLKWVPAFAKCLKENSQSVFFRALSQVTSDFLSADSAQLAGRKEAEQTQPSAIDVASVVFDTSTLTILKPDVAKPDQPVKWVYTTSPERYWYSPVKVKVVEDRAVKIVARDDVPFFDGKQDIRAFACFAKLYAPDKLKFPLKRVGERGEGKFKRISWDEALCEIAAVLKRYRDEGKAKYVAFLRTHPPLEFMFNHFAHHYGSPNDVHTSTTSCLVDGKVADALTGTGGALASDDYLNARYALYIGHNLLCGINQIPAAARFAEAIRRGMKFVFVDPRLNEGSYTSGAEWIPIKPGTDAAFILGLMNIIIGEKLYDEEFLLKHTNAPILVKQDRYPLKDQDGEYLVWDALSGKVKPLNKAEKPALLGNYEVKLDTYQSVCKTAFQLLAERAEKYTPKEVARITTIPKEKIVEIAKDLGTMKPHVCIYSAHNVSAQYSNSFQYCRARDVLMCLLGLFDKPGGKYYGPYGPTGINLNKLEDFRIPIQVHPMSKDRVDFDPTLHPIMHTKLKDYPVGVIQNFVKAIKTGEPYPIKVLFIIGSDLLASQSSEWREALKKAEFIVKSHVWPDDDVDYADIVLPEAAYLERDDGFAQVTVYDPRDRNTEFSFLTVMQQVVEPRFEERPWPDYIKELAQRIGFGEYYDFTLDECWNFRLEPMGIDIDYLREHGVYWPTPLVTRKIEFAKNDRWNTDTGRLNVYSCELVDLWHKRNQHFLLDPLPLYHAVSVEPTAENEFYLINGKCSYFKCNFYRDNAMLLEKYLEGELGNTLLWVNATKAAALGLKDRDWVWVESEATGVKDKVRIKATQGIHPSAVWHAVGYGHKAKLMDKQSRAREGINVQDFIPAHYVPFTAGAAHCEGVVKIYKA